MRQSFFILGPFSVYFYGIFISVSAFFGFLLAKKRLSKFGLKEKDLETIIIILIPSAIVGARVYHVLSWLSYYRMFTGEIFQVWRGGLGFFGAFIVGLMGLFIFSRAKKINFISLLDLLVPSVILSQAIGRLGNYFNQEAFGPPTKLPWKFYVLPDKRPINFLNQSYFHPTFFYESILCFISLAIFLHLEKKLETHNGFSFGFYLTSYGIIRFLMEFLRFDTWVISGIKVAQTISVVFIVIGVYLIRNGIRGKKLVE